MEIYKSERLPAEQAKFARRLGNLDMEIEPDEMPARPPQGPAQPNRVVRRSYWANDFPAALPGVRSVDCLRSQNGVAPEKPECNDVPIALETHESKAGLSHGYNHAQEERGRPTN